MSLFEKYDNLLERFSKSLMDGTFKSYIKKNFIKILLVYMGVQLFFICVDVYLRGYCVTCDKITQSQFDEMMENGTFIEWTNEQVYVKYPNVKTYLIDVAGGFLVTFIYTITLLVVFYTVYKLFKLLMKNFIKLKT